MHRQRTRTSLILFFMLTATLLPEFAIIKADAAAVAQESPALKTYKKFATAFMMGDFPIAKQLATGPVTLIIQRKIALINSGKEQHKKIMEPIYMIVSEITSKDGNEVKIHAVQLLQDNSDQGSFTPPDLHRQFITLHKQKSGWLLTAFRDDKEECCLP